MGSFPLMNSRYVILVAALGGIIWGLLGGSDGHNECCR